jgi:hypothetical protein
VAEPLAQPRQQSNFYIHHIFKLVRTRSIDVNDTKPIGFKRSLAIGRWLDLIGAVGWLSHNAPARVLSSRSRRGLDLIRSKKEKTKTPGVVVKPNFPGYFPLCHLLIPFWLVYVASGRSISLPVYASVPRLWPVGDATGSAAGDL